MAKAARYMKPSNLGMFSKYYYVHYYILLARSNHREGGERGRYYDGKMRNAREILAGKLERPL